MSKYFIGIMTGTSADALDGCVVSFEDKFELICSASITLDGSYKRDYEECIREGSKNTNESKKLFELENILNQKTIELINLLLKKADIDISQVSSVGFSGQTVFHTNEKSYQIGNPAYISELSKIDVYSDFRNFDIKNGGIGAPLIPAFHKYLYAVEKDRLIFNIGGIANGTYLKKGEVAIASDVGPGNCLLDYVSSKSFDKPFDDSGAEAAKGEIDNLLLKQLIDKCDGMTYPRADDKQDYYRLEELFTNIEPNSLLRTLAELSAEKIKDFYEYCGKPEEVIFHGGGTKNKFLMSLIKNKISGFVRTTDDEISSKFVEAAGFAYLAYLKKGEIFKTKL